MSIYAREELLMKTAQDWEAKKVALWRKFQVTLFFGGDDCPDMPDKIFTVQAQGLEGAVNIAIYDAMNMGYKREWVEGHHVELLD